MNLNQLFMLARDLQDIKQTDLARELGVTSSAISKFEKSRTTLSEDTLKELAQRLNLNPEYITGSSSNPFLSKKLIKMFLPEEEFGMKVVFTPILLIAEANQRIEFVTLLPARKFKFMEEVEEGTLLEPNLYAIAVRDQDNNIFLFRRRAPKAYIVGEQGLRIQLQEMSDKKDKRIVFHTRRLTKELFKRIMDWDIKKEDIEPLFSVRPLVGDLTDSEQKLIASLRESKIDPEKILKNLGRLSQS